MFFVTPCCIACSTYNIEDLVQVTGGSPLCLKLTQCVYSAEWDDLGRVWICKDCIKILDTAYEFIQRCMKSVNNGKEYLQILQQKVPKDVDSEKSSSSNTQFADAELKGGSDARCQSNETYKTNVKCDSNITYQSKVRQQPTAAQKSTIKQKSPTRQKSALRRTSIIRQKFTFKQNSGAKHKSNLNPKQKRKLTQANNLKSKPTTFIHQNYVQPNNSQNHNEVNIDENIENVEILGFNQIKPEHAENENMLSSNILKSILKSKIGLRKRRRTMKNSKLYVCTACKRGYTRRHDLKRHIDTVGCTGTMPPKRRSNKLTHFQQRQ